MLEQFFTGDMADTSRFSVPGLIVMALGVVICAFAGRFADALAKKNAQETGGSGRFGKRDSLYFAFKLGGLLITMVGAIIAVKVFG